jgi:putative oxidoreductase
MSSPRAGRAPSTSAARRLDSVPMTLVDVGLLVLRAVVGSIFAAHGAQKAFGWWKGAGWTGWNGVVANMGFRPAALWAAVSIGAELAGGLLLAIGFLTPLAAMALVGQSVVIIGKAHWAKGFWNRDGGLEFPLSLGTGAAAIGLIGPGGISLDAALGFVVGDQLRALLVVVGLVGGLASYAATLLWRPPPPATE